jgi:hypothetical protein
MSLLKRGRLVGALAIVAATAVLAVGSVAMASHQPLHVTLAGGAVLETKIQTDAGNLATISPTFVPLDGSEVTFSVPSGTTRLFDARFTAETVCVGPPNTFCNVRIVGRNNSTGFVFELNPQAPNFNWDSGGAGTDLFEAHAMERSRRVITPGSYTFFVQLHVSDPGVSFGIAIWHFAVDKHS